MHNRNLVEQLRLHLHSNKSQILWLVYHLNRILFELLSFLINLQAETNVSKTCVMPNNGNRKIAAFTVCRTNFAFIDARRRLKNQKKKSWVRYKQNSRFWLINVSRMSSSSELPMCEMFYAWYDIILVGITLPIGKLIWKHKNPCWILTLLELVFLNLLLFSPSKLEEYSIRRWYLS